jgi:hypothetical protein
MITQNPSLFIINPASGMVSAKVRGKWLFWGEGEKLAELIPKIDALVEGGELLGALVSRKTPGKDPFPHKDHILCVYTTDAKDNIERAREVMVAKLGLVPVLWKSDAQTFSDFKPGGWLKLESLIADIRKDLSDKATITSDWQIEQLKKHTIKLRAVFENAKGDQRLEMELNHLGRFIDDTEALLRAFK